MAARGPRGDASHLRPSLAVWLTPASGASSLYVNVIEVAIRRRKAAGVDSLEFRAPQIKAAFGEVIRARRLELGLTQEKLSSECGIAANSISRTERGKGNITYFNLKRLAAGLKLPASKLLICAERIEEAELSAGAKPDAADTRAATKASAAPPRKPAKKPAKPRKPVRERRAKRESESDEAAGKP